MSIGAAEVPTSAQDLLQFLNGQAEPLFALLDAARDPRVLEVLRLSGARHRSLYEGAEGKALADFAPYLVELPLDSPLREPLVHEGWGRSWGVYLTCPQPFAEVRKHFRRFLLVKSEEDGRTLYFRFYDPRVLRIFLPSCTPAGAAEFFGPIREFFVEAVDPGILIRLAPGDHGAVQTTQAVSIGAC
jgi:hypothetical protein